MTTMTQEKFRAARQALKSAAKEVTELKASNQRMAAELDAAGLVSLFVSLGIPRALAPKWSALFGKTLAPGVEVTKDLVATFIRDFQLPTEAPSTEMQETYSDAYLARTRAENDSLSFPGA